MKSVIAQQVLSSGRLFWRMFTGKGMEFVAQIPLQNTDEYVDDGQPVQPKDTLHKVVSRRSTITVLEWVEYLDKLPEEERQQHLAEEDVEGLTPIHYAARSDELEALKQLISRGADLKCTGKLGGTILHHAVQCGSHRVIDFLLDNHKKDLLHRKDFHGNTVLHYAVQCDHQKGRMGVKLLRKLIEKEADINAKNKEGASPLHLAAQLNKEKVIDALLEECDFDEETVNAVDSPGCTPLITNAVDNQGRTPLLTAAAYGKKDAIDCLCDDSVMTQVDDDGRSALFLTVEAGHSVAVKKVLDKTRKHATKPGNLLCKPNKDGDIPLHIAASKGNIKLVKMLLEYDPYHELENQTKESYAKKNEKRTEKEIQEEVEVLWKSSQYCKLERQIVQRNNAKRTPLHVAAENGQTDVVKMLLDDYPRIIPFCEEHTPDTPLHLACAKGHSKVVHYLLDEGANLKARNAPGETPFHLAAGGGHKELVEELIGVNKSCIELEDDKGRTPLRYASDERRADVVSTLLNAGAKIQSQDKSGRTVVDTAIDAGHEDVVCAIVDSDAWVEALRPHRDKKHMSKLTPFRMMIQKMPDVATKVLNRCTLQDPKKTDTVKGYCKKKDTVVFDYQFLEDFGGKPDDEGEGSYRDQDGRYNKEQHFEAVMKRDKTLSKLTSGPTDVDTHLYKSTHPLMLMVNSDSLDLLEHPLVGSLLHYKWWKFGMWVYVINLLLYLPFLLCLTIFALLVLTPESKTCRAVLSGKLDHCSTAANSDCEQCGISSTAYSAVYISALLTSLMTWSRLFIEFIQMFQYEQYLTDFTNFLELLLYSSTLIFVSVGDAPCLCQTNFQYQFGILAVFLGWINLLLFVQKFPGIGIYIVMFLKICKTFLRTVVLLLLLLTAFGLAFYMAFDEPEYERTAFSTPARALLRTTAMATGEYDFNGQFHLSPGGGSEDQTELAFLPVTVIIWIMFIAVMPILLINMLTGLAVGDVTEILNAAKLNKLALQLEMVLSVEEMVLSVVYRLPSKRLKRWFDTEKRQEVEIQKRISWWQSVTISLWGGQPYMLKENINNVLNPVETQKEKEELKAKEQANALQREVTDKLEQQMKAVSKKQEEMEKKLQESQKDVMKAVSEITARQEEMGQKQKTLLEVQSQANSNVEDFLKRSMGADISSLQQQLNSLERLVRAMAKHQGIPVEEDPDQREQ